MILWWNGWGSRPTWKGSRIHSKQMQISWEHSCAVNRQSQIHYHAVTTTIVCLNGGWLKSYFKPWLQMILWCNHWGSRPTWGGSHTLSIHIQISWEHSYAVMNGQPHLSCCFHSHFCQDSGKQTSLVQIESLTVFLNHTWWAANFTLVQWLRL